MLARTARGPLKTNQFVDIVSARTGARIRKAHFSTIMLATGVNWADLQYRQQPPGHCGFERSQNIYYAHSTHGPLPPLPYVYTQPIVNFIFKPFFVLAIDSPPEGHKDLRGLGQ